ncbi:hypothetical protein [Cryobacterium sp. SO1]|uniref:hypothetical protein n=1 Tax=Cryobacterium sp. SO1 TaxID=1897061 RepID=UPI001022DCDD|nr:hypothetical protein [Cryobacterium sp. SO1]RZI35320.1 hypothetical protein BJQ95_02387 [Cryobacterium sp. SO1]
MGLLTRVTLGVTRAPVIRQRGSEQRDWAAARSHRSPGWLFQPEDSTATPNDGREDLRTDATAIGPFSADVAYGDRVTHGGIAYQVFTDPQRWPAPVDSLAHTVLKLTRFRG